jgi:hypothetical protein
VISMQALQVMGMYRPQLGRTGELPGRDLGPRLAYSRLLDLQGNATDSQCHHRRALGSGFRLGRPQTTLEPTWRLCGQHHLRSFCGSLHCGFSADTTHPTNVWLPRPQSTSPPSLWSIGKAAVAAIVALHSRCQPRLRPRPRRTIAAPPVPTRRGKPSIKPTARDISRAASTIQNCSCSCTCSCAWFPFLARFIHTYLHHASVSCAVPFANEP